MFKFFHHLFNPHCPDCEHQLECPSCETLKTMLDIANAEKKELLNKLLNIGSPNTVPGEPVEINQPRVIPWNVRRQMLEDASKERAKLLEEQARKEAQLLKQSKEIIEKDIEKLETELGVENVGRN